MTGPTGTTTGGSGRPAGRVALVTGTGGGQGRAVALLFAAEGAVVVGCDLDPLRDKETAALVERSGGLMRPVELGASGGGPCSDGCMTVGVIAPKPLHPWLHTRAGRIA
jgi:NAD(P)-dependent dehydrogenase (short-subunit alcohol dehydrogenase family)